MTDSMDDGQHSEHSKTVYAHFGLAMFLAQVLEHGLVNALVFVELLPTRAGSPVPRKQWEAEFESFFERNFETTLGKMIRNLKAATTIPSDLETILTAALTKRNFLAHNYFRERDAAFITEAGREKMIEELQEAQALFSEADNRLTEATKAAREKFGFTDEYLNQMFEDYLSKVKTGTK